MLILRSLLGMFVKDVIEETAKKSAKQALTNQVTGILRQNLLKAVYDGITRELQFNVSNYVRAVGESSITVSSENRGEELFYSLQASLRVLELELEKQGPNSPAAKYLLEKYGGGRTSSLVGRTSQPVYMAIPGVNVDKRAWSNQPWLNRIMEDSPEVGEILAVEAARIFESLFPPSEVP